MKYSRWWCSSFKKNVIKLSQRNPYDRRKFMKSNYPLRFNNNLFNESQKGKKCASQSFVIPTSSFEIAKPLTFIKIPYCELNEIRSIHFLRKFHKFTNNSFRMVITWKFRNLQCLFPLKEKRLQIMCYL